MNRPHRMIFALAGAVMVLLVAAGAGLVYGLRGHDAVSRAVVSAIPMPAALVAGQPVWLKDIFSETEGFLSWQRKMNPPPASPRQWSDIARDVLLHQIEAAKLRALARERGIVVTEDEVSTEYAKKTIEVDSLRKELGWSEKDFREQVVAVYLLDQKLQQTLGADALDRELAKDDGVMRLWEVK